MSGRLLRGALLLILVLAAFVSIGQSRVTRAEPTGVYLALGDSVAVGIGSSLPRERGYAALVGEYFAAWSDGTMRLRNLARNGETAVSLRDDGQLDAAVADINAATAQGAPVLAISLTVGGNDAQALQGLANAERQAAVDAYAAALDTILGELRTAAGADVPIVLTSLWDPSALRDVDLGAGAWVAQLNDAMRAAADVHSVVLVDTAAAIASDLATYTYEPTDIHPTNAGHRAIAALVWQGLGVDTLPPTLELPPTLDSERTPLTLTIHAQDAVGVTALEVADPQAAEGGTDASATAPVIHGPYQTDDDTWVALVEVATSATGAFSLTVVARDAAGNMTEQDVTITITGPAATPEADDPDTSADPGTPTDDTDDPSTEGRGTPTP